MPSVLQVDPDTGELVRARGGFVRITGLDAIVQDCRIYLSLIQGEIPTRLDLGIPWPALLATGQPPAVIQQVVGQRGIGTRRGIVGQETQVDLDRAERTVRVTYRAQYSLAAQRRQGTVQGVVSILV